MDRNLTLLLLIGVLVFFGLQFCQSREGAKPAAPAAIVRAQRDQEAPKVFPAGPAAAAAQAQPVVEVGEPGEPGFRAVFDTRGAALRQLFLKDFVRRAGQDPADPENWVPVIDPGIFDAGVDAEGRKRGSYWFSFALEDPQGKINLHVPAGEADREAEIFAVPWHHEAFAEGGDRGIRFSLPLSNGLELAKEFRFPKGERHFRLAVALRNRSFDLRQQTLDWPLVLTAASAVPAESFLLGGKVQIQDFYGQPRAVAVTADRGTGKLADPVLQLADGREAPGGQALISVASSASSSIRFAGSFHKFFACLLNPADDLTREAWTDVATLKVPASFPPPTRSRPAEHVVPKLGLRVRVPEPGKETVLAFQVYAGPKDVTLFHRDSRYADFEVLYRSDLENQNCFCNIPGVGTFGRLLLAMMRFFHGFLGNWGLAIIMLTVVVRAILVPLNYKSQFEMARYQKRMAKVKPLMDAIRKKYEKNRQKMNQELMKLQREHKLTPPLMGCLPMFVTIPVFLGLFTALRVSFDLRQQPFVGWITDLSVPDMLFRLHWESGGIWEWIPAWFNVLPILMTLLWWFQQRLMPRSEDPQQKQMQTMMQFMPIVFGFMLYSYAAGLALYMTVSSTFGILESKLIRRKVLALSEKG